MGNFLTQAGSDFWEILRKKLPESFGMQWGVPDVPDTAKPVNLARSALNAYASLPTFSNEDISKGVQARVAMGGLGPRTEDLTGSGGGSAAGPEINPIAATTTPVVNPAGVRARAMTTTPSSPAVTPLSTEETVRRFARNNPGTGVNLNGQPVGDPFALPQEKQPFREYGPGELGSTTMSGGEIMPVLRRAINEVGTTGRGLDTLRNAVGRPDLAGGVMTSTDPDTGKEKLVMASFNPQRVRESFVTKPYGPGESPEDQEANQKLMDQVNKLLSGKDSQHGPTANDIKTASDILSRIQGNEISRGQLGLTARGQDIGAQSHKESLGPAWAREQLNAAESPGRMALTAAQTRKLLEPNIQTVQGFSGGEHVTMERDPGTGKWGIVTKGEGPRTNQEEGSLLGTQKALVVEKYKAAQDILGKDRMTSSPEQIKNAQDTISSIDAKLGGQRSKPTWEQFSGAAKKAGSKMSDAQLRQAYNERYGR